MAVINVRVEDHVRDLIKEMADTDGVSVSEYVRGLLIEAVVPVHRSVEDKHGDAPTPESLRIADRQVLSLLHRILGRVLPADANDVDGDTEYQLDRAHVLEQGFTGEYWKEVAGFSTELSKRDCRRVNDILQMFQVIRFNVSMLAEEGTSVDDRLARRLEFEGFDFNDSLEGHMGSYVEYLVSTGRWESIKPILEANDNGNSHSPMLDMYTRMLTEYRRIMDDRERSFTRDDLRLSVEELVRIERASVHPFRR